MKQDEIIRMALEAGLSMVLDDEGEKVIEQYKKNTEKKK